MVASAQRFSELNPGVSIRWEVRSLQQFADFPIEALATRFDLLVIDHPSAGDAAAQGTLLPLDEYLPASFLEEQAANQVGGSHDSYLYAGHQWALATDAAAPVSGFRPDLLERAGAGVPRTWPELLELARRGLVAVPGTAIDSLMNFYMLCIALGEEPFKRTDTVVTAEIGIQAMKMLRGLILLCRPACLEMNPIAIWQNLSSGDDAAYCPFAYGYSNYSRRGYSRHLIQTGGLVSIDGRACRSVLGGAGLAVSANCAHKDLAIGYAAYCAGAGCQSGLYFDSGGQPGHRGAWLDDEVNRRSNNFFRATLSTLDAAYLRPRYHGYLDFQDKASLILHRYLKQGGLEAEVIKDLNREYMESQLRRANA